MSGKINFLTIVTLLSFFYFWQESAEAQGDPTITVRLRSSRLLVSATTQTTDRCRFTLFAASKAKSLQTKLSPLNRVLLVNSQNGKAAASITGVPSLAPSALGGARKGRIFFRGSFECGSEKESTPVTSISVTTNSSSTITRLGTWIETLRRTFISRRFSLTEPFSSLTFDTPTGIANAGDGTGRLFVFEQSGRVYEVSSGAKNLFIDISDKLVSGGERGLLGMAFHPDFESNREFFLHYSGKSDGRTVLSRFSTGPDGLGNSSSEEVLLEQDQPFTNHNGGSIEFGPDGFLYLGLGDGGSGGDPEGNGQDKGTLLGKILRIDVSGSDGGKNYKIPSTNPFVGESGALPEIFAYGLRNPWRFSFDRAEGTLIAGDVGQSAKEEIDVITSGKNYGWNRMEGKSCYPPGESCSRSGLTLPIVDYGRDDGGSVTGGYVYRGSDIPALYGTYIYGDFISGKVWSLVRDGNKAVASEVLSSGELISSFGEDESGELYMLSYGDGELLKFRKR